MKFKDWQRFDQSELWKIHETYFKQTGIKAWSTGEIPYSGISNYNEAFKKAQFLIANLKKTLQPEEKVFILEIGAGYGEFAKNFLQAFKDLCLSEDLDFYTRLEYYISDYSDKTIEELQNSKRLKDFKEQIKYCSFDALDKYSADQIFGGIRFNAIFANYLLDQLPARVFAKEGNKYLEKYLRIEDPSKHENKKVLFGRNRWIKKLKKEHEFRAVNLAKEINLEHSQILETCFRIDKASTVVYSYGALKAVKNFLYLLKPNGIVLCSDFNASTKPGLDSYDPCYYGNSLAQAVNFEFIYKYFAQTFTQEESQKLKHQLNSQLGYQEVLIYEDPIKPLHTLILTRPDYEYGLELGEIYKSVYQTNWFLRALYRFVVEMQLSFYLFVLIFVGAFLIVITKG